MTRNFSKYAYTYDRYADIQRRTASELLQLVKKRGVDKILEIGSGTGNYTLLLKKRFKNATLKAIDISDKMVEVACGKIKDGSVDFIVKDAEALNLGEKFDLITSNACLQWFEELESALDRYKVLLKEKGFILFSIFGPATFWELNASLKQLFNDISIDAGNFLSEEKLKNALQRNFRKVEIREAHYEELFPCLKDLLSKIKHTGTNGNGFRNKVFFTPGLLKRLEEIYLDKFGKIKATYQVFFCRGER